MKTRLLFSILFIASFVAHAQDNSELHNSGNIPSNSRGNIVSVELGGNGIIYSLNYSRLLGNTIRARIGIEYLGDHDLNQLMIPFELYFHGKGAKLHFEIGLGLSPTYMVRKEKSNYAYLTVFARIGCSYHKPASRWNYRIGFTPFFSREISDKPIQPFGGISAGYMF